MSENDRSIMTPEEIINRLGYHDYRLPEDALKAAEDMPAIMTPLFLEYLEKVADDPRGMVYENSWLAFYALLLLARYKEGKTLPILQKMVENTPESLDWILDDALTELGSRLFASWAVSSPDALRPFIENQELDMFVRAEALEAYQCLYYNDIVTLEEMRPYLQWLAEEKLRRGDSNDSIIWYTWASFCLECGLSEFHPLIKQAYDEEWIERILSRWDDKLRALSNGKVQERRRRQLGAFITDVPGELRNWRCFTEEYRKKMTTSGEEWEVVDEDEEEWALDEGDEIVWEPFRPVAPIVNTTPKIKRNQPCPCGSGKKYKKCCGR